MLKRGSPEWRAKISATLKGRPLSEETKRKMSISRMGHKCSLDTRLKISLATTGKPKSEPVGGKKQYQWGYGKPVPIHTEEQHRKIGISISKANKGRKLSDNWKENISLGMRRATAHMTDKKDMTTRNYVSAHRWMQSEFGKPFLCEHCDRRKAPAGKIDAMYFHWANKDGQYLRDRSNWLRLCVKCHRNFDYNKSIT